MNLLLTKKRPPLTVSHSMQLLYWPDAVCKTRFADVSVLNLLDGKNPIVVLQVPVRIPPLNQWIAFNRDCLAI